MKQKKIISLIMALAVAATVSSISGTNAYASIDDGDFGTNSSSNHKTIVIDGDPVSVKIEGTQIVGGTLSAQLLKEDGSDFHSSLNSTYKWYTSPSEDSPNAKLVGENETYVVSESDIGQYIKLVVVNNADKFESTTNRIGKKSSNITLGVVTNGYWLNNSDGTKMYYENGKYITGWKNLDGVYYVFNSNGIMQTGWWKYKDKVYYLNGDGAMATGWASIDGKSYYFNNDGSLA